MKPSISGQLFSHGGVYTFSRLINQCSRFVLLPVYAHYLGKEGYGITSLMVSFTTILGMLLSQGLQGAWFRFRFDCKSEQEMRQMEATIIWHLMLSGAVATCLLYACRGIIEGFILEGIPFVPLGLIATLTAISTVSPNLYERKLQAEQRSLDFTLFTAGKTLVSVLCIILFLALFKRGYVGKIEADLLTGLIMAIYCLRIMKIGGLSLFSFAQLKKCLRYGLPMMPHNLAGLTNELIDRIIVTNILGSAATGVYSMGYNIAAATNWIASSLNQSYAPLFLDHVGKIEEKEGAEFRKSSELSAISNAGLQMIAAVSLVSLFITAFAREMLYLLPGQEFNESWAVVAPVCGGGIAMSVYFVFAQSVLYDRRKAGLIFIASSIAAAVNIAANFLLLGRIGILGASLATLVSNSAMALVVFLLSRRMLPLPTQARWLSILATAGLGLAGIYALDSQQPGELWRVLQKFLLFCAVSGIIINTIHVPLARVMELFKKRKPAQI